MDLKWLLIALEWDLSISITADRFEPSSYRGAAATSIGRGDSSHFPHIYNSTKTGGARIVCSSVMVVPHMTFMHSEY